MLSVKYVNLKNNLKYFAFYNAPLMLIEIQNGSGALVNLH